MKKFLIIFFLTDVFSCNCCSYDVYKDVFLINPRSPRSVKEENASTKLSDTNSAIVNILSNIKPYKLGYALGTVFSPTTFKSLATSLLPGTDVSQNFEHTEKDKVQIPQVNLKVIDSSKDNLTVVKEPTKPISLTILNDQDKTLEEPIKHTGTSPKEYDLTIPPIFNIQSNKSTESYDTNKTLVKDMIKKLFEEIDTDSNSEAYKGLKEILDDTKETRIKPNKKNIGDVPTIILDPHFNFHILHLTIDADKLKSEYKVKIKDIYKPNVTQYLASENSGTNVQHDVSRVLENNNTLRNESDILKTENNDINVKSEITNKSEVITNNADNPLNISDVYCNSRGQYPYHFYQLFPQLNQNYLQDSNLQMYHKNYQNLNPYTYKSTPLNIANHLNYRNEIKTPRKINVLPNVIVIGQKVENVNQKAQNRLANELNTGISGSGSADISFQEDALRNPINQRNCESILHHQPSFANTNYDYSGTGGQSNCIVHPYLHYLKN